MIFSKDRKYRVHTFSVLIPFCLCIFIITLPSRAQDDIDPTAVSAVEAWADWVDRLRGHLAPAAITREDLLFSLDYDAGAIADWVRRHIRFRQYPGVLLGPDNVLSARRANALEQAVLLAGLLKDAGFEAIVAQGELSRSDAIALLEQMRPKDAPAPLQYDDDVKETLTDGERVADLFSAFEGDAPGNRPGFPVSDNVADSEAIVQKINDSLLAKGISLSPGKIPNDIIHEARRYTWVQYRLAASDPWTDVHTAFPGDFEFEQTPQRQSVISDAVPDDLFQKIRIEFFARRRSGPTGEVVALMDAWERPVANLGDQPIEFATTFNPRAIAAGSDPNDLDLLFIPYLNGSPAPGAKAFDKRGTIVPADVALSSLSGVFSTANRSMSAAAEALSDLDGDEQARASPLRALTGVWLEITVITPGKPQRTLRRTLIATGKDARNTDIARHITIDVTPSDMSLAARENMLLETYARSLRQIAARARRVLSGNPEPLEPTGDPVAVRLHQNMMRALVFAVPKAPDDAITYRTEPLLVATHLPPLDSGNQGIGLDILHNERRSFTRDDGRLAFWPLLSLRAGVWETMSEKMVIESALSDGTARIINAASSFDSILESRVEPIVLDASAPADDADPTAPASREIDNALSQGHAVILAKPDADAFWRVDRDTGVALGITRNGWGGGFSSILPAHAEELVEYGTTKMSISIAFCLNTVYLGCTYVSKMTGAAVLLSINGGFQAADFFLSPTPMLIIAIKKWLLTKPIDWVIRQVEKIAMRRCLQGSTEAFKACMVYMAR